MTNLKNFGVLEGRLTKDIKVFENSDGSKKVMFTLAAQDNFKGKSGQKESQFIPLVGFISKSQSSNGVYDYIHKGDSIAVRYELRNNNYTDKSGEKVYGIDVFIQEIELREGKAVTQARQAKITTPEQVAETVAEPVPEKTKKPAKSKKADKEEVAADVAPTEEKPF